MKNSKAMASTLLGFLVVPCVLLLMYVGTRRKVYDQVRPADASQMRRFCPQCLEPPLDREAVAAAPYRAHRCEFCGCEWRPVDR